MSNNVPRKLGIVLEFDFTSDENRRIHKSKAQQVADEAIQAASKVVQDGLLDEAISAAVRTRIQWDMRGLTRKRNPPSSSATSQTTSR